MTALGASGATKTGILEALRAKECATPGDFTPQLQILMTALVSSDPRVTCSSANSLWSLVLSADFVDRCWKTFKAEARIEKPEAVPINKWCSDQTNAKITEVFDPSEQLDDEGAILVNALYFNGQW